MHHTTHTPYTTHAAHAAHPKLHSACTDTARCCVGSRLLALTFQFAFGCARARVCVCGGVGCVGVWGCGGVGLAVVVLHPLQCNAQFRELGDIVCARIEALGGKPFVFGTPVVSDGEVSAYTAPAPDLTAMRPHLLVPMHAAVVRECPWIRACCPAIPLYYAPPLPLLLLFIPTRIFLCL